ncbi:MAG: hypothetical protein E7242_02560 [Lachnospiraceae bacterium]|nr:hypothetical protein [Lachnospiraceae bacterium]
MDKKIWLNPKSEKSLDEAQIPLWFWNDKLNNDELERQLKLKSQTGIKSTIPHARLNGGEGYIGGYLDDEWFEKTNLVLEYKRKNKESLWLYDEMDWPAGTCNKTLTKDEKNREQYLNFEKHEIKRGEIFRCQLRKLGTVNNKAVYNVKLIDKQSNTVIPEAKYISEDEFSAVLNYKAEKNTLLYLVYIRIDSYEDFGSGCVNYIDDNVTKRFIESTYEKYYKQCKKYFGKEIKAVFNDETRMANAFVWKDGFDDDFKSRKGYSFLPHIFDLILEGEEAGRHRIDYYSVVADLFSDNFLGLLKKWCNERNLKFYAHLLGEETMASQVRYSGEFMRQAKNMDIVGVDHLGKGIGSLNAKFGACAAHSYGKDDTAIEIFAGCGWDLTFEEYKRMIFWAFQQGMKRIINHGFFYSTRGKRKNDWPPSQFFQWKDWDKASLGNDIIRRLHMAMTAGVSESDCLVYYPTESFIFDYIGDQNYKHGYLLGPVVKNKDAQKLDINLQKLFSSLQNANLDFELLHEDALDNFKQHKGRIINKANLQNFSLIIIPWTKIMSYKSLKLIYEFCLESGKVLLIGFEPKLCLEKINQNRYNDLLKKLLNNKNVSLLNNNKDIVKAIEKRVNLSVKMLNKVKNTSNCLYSNGLIDPYIHTGEDIKGIRFVKYKKDNKRHTLIVNYDDCKAKLKFCLKGKKAEIFELTSGKSYTKEIINSHVEFEIEANDAIVMVNDI